MALSSPPSTPKGDNADVDVVSHYEHLIESDPSLTPPIAAIESLIAVLTASKLTTVSETLQLLSKTSQTLIKSQHNALPISAGTELFQRYIVASFQNTPISSQSGNDFTQLRNHLITNSKLFVSRTKAARSKIARHALPFVRDDCTIYAYGASRVIDAVLLNAAGTGRTFNVVYISSGEPDGTALDQSVQRLVGLGVPVAKVPFAALSHSICSLPKSSTSILFFLGAEAVLENGAALSNMGSRVVAEIARVHRIPCYFAAESYKFTRAFPTEYGDQDLQAMGANQNILRWKSSLEKQPTELSLLNADPTVDITPPELITALVTENGAMTPNAVAEELIKLWF